MGLRAYIEDDAIINELKKYGDIKSEVIRLKYKTRNDLVGIENGNRLVRMVLTAASIPYSIKIDREWCRIIHSNQKPICTVCHEEGHRRADCPSVVCFNCRQKGHICAKCSKDEFGWDKDANPAAALSEEERHMKIEELLRKAAAIDRGKDLFYDTSMDGDEDDGFNGYTSTGYDSANEVLGQTLQDLG